MSRPIHFEIHAEHPEAAIKFYDTLFGWKFQKWEGGNMEYWMVITGSDTEKGINGGLMKRMGPNPPLTAPTPVIAYVCTVNVDNLDAYTEKAVANGGTVAMPKMPIPGMGWLAYVKDTEGNIFGMMQNDPAAK